MTHHNFLVIVVYNLRLTRYNCSEYVAKPHLSGTCQMTKLTVVLHAKPTVSSNKSSTVKLICIFGKQTHCRISHCISVLLLRSITNLSLLLSIIAL